MAIEQSHLFVYSHRGEAMPFIEAYPGGVEGKRREDDFVIF
jgi:hypothetical protein